MESRKEKSGKRMGLCWRFAFGLLLAGLGVFPAVLSGCRRTVSHHTPVIDKLGRFSVTILWESDEAVSGKIHYAPDDGRERSVAETAPVRRHRLTITGLLPRTRYHYRIDGLPGEKFHFTTAPVSGGPFRFCAVGDTGIDTGSLMGAYPDFIVLSGTVPKKRFTRLGAFLPLYRQPEAFEYEGYSFSWNVADRAAGDAQDAETGFIFYTGGSELPDSSRAPGGWVMAVFGSSDTLSAASYGDAILCAVPAGGSVFEIQEGEIRAGTLEQAAAPPVLVRHSSLSYEKTCVYCHRLMENRQYRKSIGWYLRFIADNREGTGLEDAVHKVAHIYDTYLFEYDSARAWYLKLVDDYPHSALAAQARFRLSYIEAHADHSYEPLRIFEHARLTYQADRRASIDSVARAVKRYPGSSLRNEMLLWLGNVCAPENPSKAIEYLSRVIRENPSGEHAYQAGLAVGDIHYGRRDYQNARAAYQSLSDAFPARSAELEIKIFRSRRNNFRRLALFFCMAFLFVYVMTAALVRPRGLAAPPWKAFVTVLSVYASVGVVSILCMPGSRPDILPFAAVLGFSLSVVTYFFFESGRKAAANIRCMPMRISVNALSGAAAGFCVFYIAAYFFHFLFVFDGVLQ